MKKVDWRCLQGQVLDGKFEIGAALQTIGSCAFFRAKDLTSSEEVLVRAEDAEESSSLQHFDRFREACFLEHPNLLRVIATGEAEYQQLNFIYLVTEMVEVDLAEVLQSEPLTLDGAKELLRQIVSGLAYMHSENLVYCALRAGSVWRVGSQWKLADYSQLRVVGKYPGQETRRLLLVPSFECPPEANISLVSEAWDTWSLGSMLRKIVLRVLENEEAGLHPDQPVSLNRLSIPVPFDQILRESLDPDPAIRATLDRVLEILAAPRQSRSLPDPVVAIESPVPEQPVVQEQIVPEPKPVEVPPSPAIVPSHPKRSVTNSRPATLGIIAASLAILLALVHSSRVVDPQSVRGNSAANVVLPPPQPIPEKAAELVRHDPFGDQAQGQTADGPQAQAAILQLLNQWAEATRRRDVEQEVNCYAPLVDTFYGQRGVSATRLRSQEKSVFTRIGTVRKFQISKVRFSKVSPEWAVVSFDKDWDFGNQSRFAGSARDELVVRPIQGQWKIASQREVKLYWVDKHSPNPGV